MSGIYISEKANDIIKNHLISQGHKLIEVGASSHFTGNGDTSPVYKQIADHPDLYMCKLGARPDAPVFHIADFSELGRQYPQTCAYNGVCIGEFFIHNLNYTSPGLLQKIKELGLTPIHTKQGYTKCNVVVVDDHSLITSDKGIIKAIQNSPARSKLDILEVQAHNIILDGFPYGFLGGCSGKVGKTIIFNGNLSNHPDFHKIKSFIGIKRYNVYYFEEYPLTDIGTIIEEY